MGLHKSHCERQTPSITFNGQVIKGNFLFLQRFFPASLLPQFVPCIAALMSDQLLLIIQPPAPSCLTLFLFLCFWPTLLRGKKNFSKTPLPQKRNRSFSRQMPPIWMRAQSPPLSLLFTLFHASLLLLLSALPSPSLTYAHLLSPCSTPLPFPLTKETILCKVLYCHCQAVKRRGSKGREKKLSVKDHSDLYTHVKQSKK